MAKKEQKTFGGDIIATFVPLQNFHSATFSSDYVKGMSYNIREGNAKLVGAVAQWREEGLVK